MGGSAGRYPAARRASGALARNPSYAPHTPHDGGLRWALPRGPPRLRRARSPPQLRPPYPPPWGAPPARTPRPPAPPARRASGALARNPSYAPHTPHDGGLRWALPRGSPRLRRARSQPQLRPPYPPRWGAPLGVTPRLAAPPARSLATPATPPIPPLAA